MSGNFLIDYGPVAGAFATVIIAYLTLWSVRLAKRKLNHMEREAALDRLPHHLFKDMCLVPVTASDAAFPKLRIDTKGAANLGRFAAAVCRVLLLDKEGRQLASAWPLRIVEAGTVFTDSGRGPNEVPAVSRESGGMTTDDLHPKLAVPLAQLADLADSVQLEFAYGGDDKALDSRVAEVPSGLGKSIAPILRQHERAHEFGPPARSTASRGPAVRGLAH